MLYVVVVTAEASKQASWAAGHTKILPLRGNKACRFAISPYLIYYFGCLKFTGFKRNEGRKERTKKRRESKKSKAKKFMHQNL